MCAEPARPKTNRFFKIREVAEELGISERAAWRLIEQGELASHGFGGSTRVRRDDLDAYIARSRRTKPPTDNKDDRT